jgi:glutamate-1-semialdehyde 2,1-aminomutase
MDELDRVIPQPVFAHGEVPRAWRGLTPRVEAMRDRLQQLVPGGCHTYAKGGDQFPQSAPPFIERGHGCHSWDLDGNEYIEYGMGLRSVTLGHAFAPVVDAVRKALGDGTNFSRPSPIELECAECFLQCVPTAEMVKFCKDGSHAVDGAVRLARAWTGRDVVAICADHPFFSTSDWFIGTTAMKASRRPRVGRSSVSRTTTSPASNASLKSIKARLRAW